MVRKEWAAPIRFQVGQEATFWMVDLAIICQPSPRHNHRARTGTGPFSELHDAAGVRCAIYTRKELEDGLEQDFKLSRPRQRRLVKPTLFAEPATFEGWGHCCQDRLLTDGGIIGVHLRPPGISATAMQAV